MAFPACIVLVWNPVAVAMISASRNQRLSMNIDLNQDEIQLIIRHLVSTSEEGEKLSKKLLKHVFPEVDEEHMAEKWQEWKK